MFAFLRLTDLPELCAAVQSRREKMRGEVGLGQEF